MMSIDPSKHLRPTRTLMRYDIRSVCHALTVPKSVEKPNLLMLSKGIRRASRDVSRGWPWLEDKMVSQV